MKSLAILGAGGHAKVVADAALCSGWQNITFFDDKWPETGHISTWSISGTTQSLIERASEFDGIVVAIGNNAVRMQKIRIFLNQKLPLETIIHPSAIISPSAVLAAGTVVFARAVLNPECTIGLGSIINTGAIIEHDCMIGHSVHISPGVSLSGHVHVGDFSWLGIGSCVRQCIKIGSRVMVGAGSVVIKDLPDDCLAFGVPAKIYNKNYRM